MNHLIAFALTLATCSSTLAQHAGDIVLSVENGRIRTSVEVDGGAPQPSRVFASELGEVEPGYSDEPGFDNLPGTFPFPSGIGFRVVGPMLRWANGVGDGRDPETMHVAFSVLGPVDSGACNNTVEGFSLPVGSNGTWHRHLEFTINPAAPTGVYLLGLALFSTAETFAPSESFWIVFNHSAPETDHDAAIQWAEVALAARACDADFDASSAIGVPDIFAFLSAWFGGADNPDGWRADFDGSCTLGVPDIFAFLSAWFAGCG